jgi:hypothetical protein
MAKCLTILAAFLFLFVPAVTFAQNNCISYHCYFPPDDCAYCGASYTNGNSSCTADPYGNGCWLSGFCDTGLGGCINAADCTDVMYRDFWIRMVPPKALREEWQLVDVSVKRKTLRHPRNS